MQLRKLLFIGALLCAVCAFDVAAQSDDEYEIFNLVNRERAKSRLAMLNWDDDLARVARSYSKKMARERFFGHYDRDGESVVERANDARLRWVKIGENLFFSDDTPQITTLSVRGWMRSATHRRNIQDRGWTATGIGIARSRDDQIYITQIFVRR
jgi:uncharacterized protein YkwD